MSDSGLTNRLRQHSRRSGLAVGLTMAAAIALGILASAWLFGRIEPYVSDFTGYEQRTAVPAVAEASEDAPADPTQAAADAADSDPSPTEPAQQPTVGPVATATTSTFEQTHLSNPDFTVNFRPGPSIASGDPVATLDPGTPLQYLDEQTVGDDGSVWLRMTTQDGIEGWLREVDTVPAA